MLNKLLDFLRRYDMVSSGDTVVCAVSGGADSVALLMGMYLVREKLDFSLQAAHFNHHLRGEESDGDEAFVAALCDRLDIPLHRGQAQVKAGEKGLEAAARDARYSFFETLPGKLATAHTADDNAETVLMHMVRGTGLKGLGGIAPVRGKYIRPMLLITREEVLAFLREYNLSFVEDSSNAADVFLRNRLRHHVMPLLARENPRLAENTSAMALRLREDEEALSVPVSGTEIAVSELAAMPRARRSRALSAFLENCGVKEPEAQHIALAEALVFSDKPSAMANFPGGVTLRRSYDMLRREEKDRSFQQVSLACPGVTEIPQLGLRVICEAAEKGTFTTDAFTVKITGDPVLRPRMPGDEMRLSGGKKTLKKLLIDKKVPAAQRSLIPVIADEKGVVGVYTIGVNLDRHAKESPCILIRFERIEK